MPGPRSRAFWRSGATRCRAWTWRRMVGLGASHQVEAVLQDAAQVMERNVVANLQLEDRLREVNQTMGYILQEAQMDEDAVAAAYQRIVADESLEIQG